MPRSPEFGDFLASKVQLSCVCIGVVRADTESIRHAPACGQLDAAAFAVAIDVFGRRQESHRIENEAIDLVLEILVEKCNAQL